MMARCAGKLHNSKANKLECSDSEVHAEDRVFRVSYRVGSLGRQGDIIAQEPHGNREFLH